MIYAALYPEKVKNLITLATPTQFDIDDAGLFLWAKGFNVDKPAEGLGNLPGDWPISFISSWCPLPQ